MSKRFLFQRWCALVERSGGPVGTLVDVATVLDRVAKQIVRALGIKRRLSRLAEVDDDPGAFNQRLRRLRRTDRRLPPWTVRLRWEVEHIDVSGFDLFLMTAGGSPGRRVLFYLHGGGYLFGPFGTEWAAMRKVAERSGSDFAMLLYPRAPEHNAEEALNIARVAYGVLADRIGVDRVLPVGTSAGGGLAIAMLATLRDEGREGPPCAVLVSPGVDMTLEQPVGDLEQSDVLLSTAHVRSAGRLYAGALGPEHPTISPLYGELDHLPKLHVFVGGAELLRPSIEAFARKALAAGTEVDVVVGDDQQHTWPIAPTPEGRKSLRDLIDIVSSY